MRLRSGILVLTLMASLTACGSGDDTQDASDKPTGSATSSQPDTADPGTVDAGTCTKFLAGQAKAAELSKELTPGSDIEDAIKAANAQFEALKADAPDDIKGALTAVQAAYTALGKFYSDPSSMTADSAADIEKATKDLQENAIKLNSWIIQNCS